METDESGKLVVFQDRKMGAVISFNEAPKLSDTWPLTSTNLFNGTCHCFVTDLNRGMSEFLATSADLEVNHDTLLTEIINPENHRTRSLEMTGDKNTKVKSGLRRRTFKLILWDDLPPHGNILPVRLSFSITYVEDVKMNCKVRYVISGHRDNYKDLVMHSTSTLLPHSTRLLLALASIFCFDIWTSDVRQA